MVKTLEEKCSAISDTTKVYLDIDGINATMKTSKFKPFWDDISKEILSASLMLKDKNLFFTKNPDDYPDTVARYMKISSRVSKTKKEINWQMSKKIEPDIFDETNLKIRSIVYRLKLTTIQNSYRLIDIFITNR